MYLHTLSNESRMRLLSIAAARLLKLAGDAHHLSGWESRLRVGRGLLSGRVHRKALSQIDIETEALEKPGGGPGESAEACGARWALLRTQGFTGPMKLADLIERDPNRTSRGAVFVGTSVPIKLLFEFLQDDQTMDTFLDQFPMVTRDQARGVLGASRDMLLSAAGSET
jgi:uncharacterized protein (DUF433 family)